MNMRISWAVLRLTLLATLALTACSTPAEDLAVMPTTSSEEAVAVAGAEPTAIPIDAEPRIENGRLVIPGRAVPEYSLDLGFERSGVVAELLVALGDEVSAGDPLARLDTRNQELEVESARASLDQARSNYERLIAGSSPAELAQAAARLQRARGTLQRVAGEVSEQDLVAAREEVTEMQLRLEQLLAGPRAETIQVAQARVAEDVAALETARTRASTEKTLAESDLQQIANNLRDAQDRYSRISWENQGRANLPQADIDREQAALRDVQNAEEELRQAQVEFDQARQQEVSLIEAAEARLREAQAQLEAASRGPTPDDIAGARANLAAAQARLDALNGEERAGSLAEAEAQVLEAQAAIDRLTADPETSDLAIAEATVVRAEVALKQTELSLEQMMIRAPSDGTIASLDISVGEVVEARVPVMLLASFSTWQVQVEDLNELNIVHIREGDEAIIRFFALPDLELRGRVTSIETRGRNDRNTGTVYSVVVTPDAWDDRLRWNMSASVTIVPATP
jgi:HlyD family secretion protein